MGSKIPNPGQGRHISFGPDAGGLAVPQQLADAADDDGEEHLLEVGVEAALLHDVEQRLDHAVLGEDGLELGGVAAHLQHPRHHAHPLDHRGQGHRLARRQRREDLLVLLYHGGQVQLPLVQRELVKNLSVKDNLMPC